MVGDTGIEPVTSSVSGKRAPAAPIAPGKLAEVETGFEPVYTALQAVASPLGHSTEHGPARNLSRPLRADDGIRTRDPHLGKVMRYQLRYVRLSLRDRSPVTDTNFSRSPYPMPNRGPTGASRETYPQPGNRRRRRNRRRCWM